MRRICSLQAIVLLILSGCATTPISTSSKEISTFHTAVYQTEIAKATPTLTVIAHTPTALSTPTPKVTPILNPDIGSNITRPTDNMVMMYIPAGEFSMGSNTSTYVVPRFIHPVFLDAFWIDSTEVTNSMYVAFLNEVGNQMEDSSTWINTTFDNSRIQQTGDTWHVQSEYENHPVNYVNWYGANAYCHWAGGRLPTEAEWEKAARGGLIEKLYPWGNELPVCAPGAKNGAQYGSCNGESVPVKTFTPNAYGLYDMTGNADEWVSDWFDTKYYNLSPKSNPQGPDTGTIRGARGGGWQSYKARGNLEISSRGYGFPYDNTLSHSGFRCALSFSASPTYIHTLPTLVPNFFTIERLNELLAGMDISCDLPVFESEKQIVPEGWRVFNSGIQEFYTRRTCHYIVMLPPEVFENGGMGKVIFIPKESPRSFVNNIPTFKEAPLSSGLVEYIIEDVYISKEYAVAIFDSTWEIFPNQ